jgi:hypothetical protein
VSVAYNTSSSCARHFNPLVIGLGFFDMGQNFKK